MTVRVPGMHCQGCVSTIKMVLQRIADVEVEADLDRKLLRVKYRGASPEQIKSALAEAGFTPEEAA